MGKILGLDLGTNSIGWAIVEKESDSDFQLIEKGVRIFQEGVKIEKGIESSKAAERTSYRSARRLKYRRKLRKIATLKVLSAYGYCPELSVTALNNWRYKKQYPVNEAFMNWQKTDETTQKNPYRYRALAVEQKLDLSNETERFMLGRAFYHIAQRRGFLSNRLEGTKESDGAVKKEIEEISVAKGDKTLGQYFFSLYQENEKIRGRYTHREMHYIDEFERICRFQKISDEMRAQLKRAIFYQRPLKSQKGSIGKCVFEPKKPRCAVSRPEFEEYRMLCFINNIRIKAPDDEKLRELSTAERLKIRPVFFRKSKEHFDFEDIAKQLAPKHQYKFYKVKEKYSEDWLFNFPMNTTVSGCPVSARFKELFGNEFITDEYLFVKNENGELSKKVIDAWHALFSFDSEEKLKEFASNTLGLNEPQVAEYLKIHLKQDYASLSLKAIRNITPYLNEGLLYSHAVFLANMHKAVPARIWNDRENREIIKKEIQNIIETQNEEKQLIEIVNGIIKRNKEEGAAWSEEAKPFFRKDIFEKVKSYYGPNTYALFDEDKRSCIEQQILDLFERQMQKNRGTGEFAKVKRIDERVSDFILDNFDTDEKMLENLYHPSAIEIYKEPVKGKDGRLYLGSPMVSSVRNPMAMRALHQLRKVINKLIRNDLVDATTKIHIEMARDLKNANERKALQSWQNERERLRKTYAEKITEHFNTIGINRVPSDDEILKYQLWEEQNHKCIYTGREISLRQFLGANPEFDIEHTIPRSVSLDNSMENKTLCESVFNRAVKRNKIPTGLVNHSEILARIEHWKEKYEELDKQIQKAVRRAKGAADKAQKDSAIQARHKLTFERDYWQGKYRRFTMKDVPDGFKNSQLVDTGIITKYARLYLQTLFSKVYTVKGNTVADFRKLWGLQEEYEKKERVNHIHHCIDAVTIACITKENYEALARFYHDWDEYRLARKDEKPHVDKPWATFPEDMKKIEEEVLISHHTPDVLPRQSKKILRKRGKKQYTEEGKPIYQQGDTARGSLHQQTFYGAIEVEEEGQKQIKYVVRKPLDSLDDNSLKNIVDYNVRSIIENGRRKEKEIRQKTDNLRKQLSKAKEEDEPALMKEISSLESQINSLYCMPNRNGTPIPIKRVRIYSNVTNPLHFNKKQRDKKLRHSKPYKEEFNVANDSNYLMAIYEGTDEKGKLKRDFELINNIDAGAYFKYSTQRIINFQGFENLEGLIPFKKEYKNIEMPLRALLKIGTMILLWENEPEEVRALNKKELDKRLYKVVGLSTNRVKSGNKYYEFGNVVLRFHKVAIPASELKTCDGEFKSDETFIAQRKLSHNQFNALVEGIDFRLTPLGGIDWLN
ncbi:MAG: type II CRISPR RNA-guided endonuclease Cas9 [Prolixibacteraceae bacterium]|jgi:CRISPR-associated endonuclease Csn1|nr:type II CRISPR RNA-guided endonuclease Cas9 [Prolixibacteraceae bacterium]